MTAEPKLTAAQRTVLKALLAAHPDPIRTSARTSRSSVSGACAVALMRAALTAELYRPGIGMMAVLTPRGRRVAERLR